MNKNKNKHKSKKVVEVPRHVDKVRSAGFQRASWQRSLLFCFEVLGSLRVTFEVHHFCHDAFAAGKRCYFSASIYVRCHCGFVIVILPTPNSSLDSITVSS